MLIPSWKYLDNSQVINSDWLYPLLVFLCLDNGTGIMRHFLGKVSGLIFSRRSEERMGDISLIFSYFRKCINSFKIGSLW